MSTSPYSSIQQLLEFHNSFINLVHSEIFSYTQPSDKKQALLKFQILRMSEKNDLFQEIIASLRKQLIEEKHQADPILKNYFNKLLDLDFLPFLHINRYELTKLSIFGFDIYIDPLEAILQILNRLERLFYILEESLNEHQKQFVAMGQKSAWDVLISGWSNYYIYLNFYKLSLNIYMLKEYIQTAGTSLFKKDKQIIFTGVYNLYKKVIPRLIQLNQVEFLQELADLNNTMYSFHGSFDYFVFFTYILPQPKFIKVYQTIRELEKKCTATNILTPLLFGILNNYKAFNKFIDQVQSPVYIHLLRLLLSGLVINFKLRILEYDQVLNLVGSIITKLNLLKAMKFQIISANLPNQWKQAKDFFISAFKSGYNVGEIQTWNICDTDLIQPKIRDYLTLGILLTKNCKYDSFLKSLDKLQLDELLSRQISELTSNAQTINSLGNNWKPISLTQSDQTQQSGISKCLNIIRIINLLNVTQNYSEKMVYAVCSAMISAKCESVLVQESLREASETLNTMITAINRKESISHLKQILTDFHKKFTPKTTFQDIVPVYLHCFIIKEGLTNLVDVMDSMSETIIPICIKQTLTSLIQKYCRKPRKTFQTIKSFQKQYKVPYELVHMGSQISSIFTTIIKILTVSEGGRFNIASQLLVNLLRYCPWYVVTVLNMPASTGQNIQSFLRWLIKNNKQKRNTLLKLILKLIHQYAKQYSSGNILEYLQQGFYYSVLDNFLNVLNQLTTGEKWQTNPQCVNQVLNLLQLFLQIEQQFLQPYQLDNLQNNQEETSHKIWHNFLQLLSFIIRNSQLSLQQTSNCCKVYWQIIKRVKGKLIKDWYKKMLFNLIFSTASAENLTSYDSFKGIILISNPKNYMISKQLQSVDQQEMQKQGCEGYNYSDIKKFLQKNFKGIEQQSSEQQKRHTQIDELIQVIKQGRNQAPIKISSSSHLTSDVQVLPCFSQERLAKIYGAYNEGKNQDKEWAQFCLNLLKLNSSNHKILWRLAMDNQKSMFLNHLTFTRQNATQVFQVLAKLEKTTTSQSSQNSVIKNSQTLKNKFLQMLNIYFLSQNVNYLELFASSYYFQTAKIDVFLHRKQLLWFLIVCNNSNWRQFNETYSSFLKHLNFLSTLLQYKQYISITNKSNSDYEIKIQQFANVLGQYVFYINKKIQFIKLLQTSDSEKENEIRKSTLLLNINLVLLKCEFEKMFERMSAVGKLCHQYSLSDQKLKSLINVMHSLNDLCNYLSEGSIKLPSFGYHNSYMTSNSEQRQLMLGRWLENVQRVFGHQQGHKYWPSKQRLTVKNSIEEFLQVTKINVKTSMALNLDCEPQKINNLYIKIKDQQKDIVNNEDKTLQVILQPQIEVSQPVLNQLYNLGFVRWLVQKQSGLGQQNNLQKVSPLLSSLINRQKLPLQLIKEVEPSAYHSLKLTLMEQNSAQQLTERIPAKQQNLTPQKNKQKQDQQIKDQKIPVQTVVSDGHSFVWKEKQLVEGGRNIKITQINKSDYVQLVGQQILGKNYLNLNNAIALGYLNAKIFKPID